MTEIMTKSGQACLGTCENKKIYHLTFKAIIYNNTVCANTLFRSICDLIFIQ